jgi:hypothetical protein
MLSNLQNHNSPYKKDRGTVNAFSFGERCKRHTRFPMSLIFSNRCLLIVSLSLLLIAGTNSLAYSATYFLAPSGVDSNPGTSAAPWKTFAFAIPRLQPGDTLILKDGTYNQSNSGYPTINGNNNAKNGTKDKPITVKAEHERKAFIAGNGARHTVIISNLSYWNFEGIYAKSAENQNVTSAVGYVFHVTDSKNISFRRLLVSHNNRWVNTHLVGLIRCDSVLVEESEFYSFHRHGILNFYTNNSVYRRNYFNSRGYADTSGGRDSLVSGKGDTGISNYPGSYNIIENNISENNGRVSSVQATIPAVGNRFLGNISLNEEHGLILQARGEGDRMPIDTVIENHVVINPSAFGIYDRTTKNTKIKNVSLLGGREGQVSDFIEGRGDGNFSTFSTNVLVMNSSIGFRIRGQSAWSIDYPGVFNNETNFSPSTNVSNVITLNPGLGTCLVFLPQNSPLKGKGLNGEDIGANILNRYEKGELTTQPLWDPISGEFPHGAMVPGVNDMAGTSVFDIHKRLNVNSNGCGFPQGYAGGGGLQDLTPQALRIVTSGN